MLWCTECDSSGAGAVFVFALIALAFVGYWLPLIVATARRVPHIGSVAVLNLLLGWTLVGWVVAMAMACRDNREVIVSTLYPAQLPVAQPPPGWFPDSTSRHQLRYWDGTRWTSQVSDKG